MIEFSFLLPTRGRPDLVNRLFQSIVDTTDHLAAIEVIMVIDDDDLATQAIMDDRINLKKVIIPRGASMGTLNMACFEASSGRYVIVANDDIILRTKGWDRQVAAVFALYPDDTALVHVNDLLFRERLCTFPITSRKACLKIGLCPTGYWRYKIDDHIYDTYSMLAYLGHKRIVYLPDVIFEHENHDNAAHADSNEHIFKSNDNKVYTPKKEFIDKDHQLFMSTFEQRKQDAIALANLIDSEWLYSAQQRWRLTDRMQPGLRLPVYNVMLTALEDPYAYRQKDLVKIFPSDPGGLLFTPRVTVAVVSANIKHQFASECIDRIKKYTKNYDLIIFDNNRGPDFRHAREMNKILQIATTDFLVLMDDDVYVEEGWLTGLLKCMDDRTAVVVPLHKDKEGNINFSGMYLAQDGTGNHEHLTDIPEHPREVQVACSALLLIDLCKCGQVYMDEKYSKYYFDPVHSCEIWEKGYKVICTPEVVITHLAGATMIRGTEEAAGLWTRDGKIFYADWVKTGRLQKLNDTWRQYPALRPLVTIAERTNRIFERVLELDYSTDEFSDELAEILSMSDPYPLFLQVIAEKAQKTILALGVNMPDKARLCTAAINYMLSSDHPIYHPYPLLLLNNYKGFNCVLYKDKCYGLALALGPVDLATIELSSLEQYQKKKLCCIATSLKKTKALIDQIVLEPEVTSDSESNGRSGSVVSGYEFEKANLKEYPFLITAIVNTPEPESHIQACLEDLEAQTISNRIEIMIMDNGLQRSEREIIRTFQKKYPNIIVESAGTKNKFGVLNQGIENAKGKYITVADLNDRHHPDAFRRMTDILEAHAQVGVVYHDSAVSQMPNATLTSGPITGRLRLPDFNRTRLFQTGYISPQVMWRKALIEWFGGFDPELEQAGEYEFWLRISDKVHFYHIPEVLGLYIETSSRMKLKNPDQDLHESEIARSRHWKNEDGQRPEPQSNLVERYIPEVFSGRENQFPLVSVIITTANNQEGLRRSLDSIHAQIYPRIDVIVVNYGKQRINPIVYSQKRKTNTHYEFHEVKKGVGTARNEGIRYANGKYIAFLDDDGFFRPEHLCVLVAEIESNSSWVASYDDVVEVLIDKTKGLEKIIDRKVTNSKNFSRQELLIQNYISLTGLLFHSKALELCGYFDENLPVLEDWDWLIRLSKLGSFTHIPVSSAEYCVRQSDEDQRNQQPEQLHSVYKTIYRSNSNLSSAETRLKQKQMYASLFGTDLETDAPDLFEKKIKVAADPVQTLGILLATDDIGLALDEQKDNLDLKLLTLVRQNAETARQENDLELADGLDGLAEYIQNEIESRIN